MTGSHPRQRTISRETDHLIEVWGPLRMGVLIFFGRILEGATCTSSFCTRHRRGFLLSRCPDRNRDGGLLCHVNRPGRQNCRFVLTCRPQERAATTSSTRLETLSLLVWHTPTPRAPKPRARAQTKRDLILQLSLEQNLKLCNHPKLVSSHRRLHGLRGGQRRGMHLVTCYLGST